MDPDATRTAQAALRPGERLRWAGRPTPGALARSQLERSLTGVPILAFALLWLHFVGPPVGSVLDAVRDFGSLGNLVGVSGVFWLVGIVLALVGLWTMLAAPLAFVRAGRMAYGVTDQRVLICSGRRVQSWGPQDMNMLERTERNGGSGSIRFRRDVQISGKGTRSVTYQGLYGIPRVREVEAMIARLRDTRAA